MKKEKILLVAGCSHMAGSEIDGNEDSTFNRQHSFGALVAKHLGRKVVHVAQVGALFEAFGDDRLTKDGWTLRTQGSD